MPEQKTFAPGFYRGISNRDYHGSNGISKSGLDLIDRSPLHYRFRKDNPDLFEPTPDMIKGTLIHTLLLEPHMFVKEYAVMPESIKRKQGKEYEAFIKDAGDREVLTHDQWDDAKLIAAAVTDNPEAFKILEDAISNRWVELSVYAEDFETGELCKCRPDLICSDGRKYDLKTTGDAGGRPFSYSARNFRYHVQAAFYDDVCEWAGIDPNGFGFVAVDKSRRPYQCVVYHRLEQDAMDLGRRLYRSNLNTYAECVRTGEWPGYPEAYDRLTISGYAYDLEEQP